MTELLSVTAPPRTRRGGGAGLESATALGVLLAVSWLLPASAREVSAAPSPIHLAIALAHVVCLGTFLGLRFSRWRFDSPLELPREAVARAAWRQFQVGIDVLTLAWTLLYLWLSCVWSASLWPELFPAWLRGPRSLAVADVLNASGSVAFFYLYLVLDRPSVPAPGRPERDADFGRAWTACLCIGFGVGLLSLLGRLGHLGLDVLGPMAGSFFAAIAMMYLFGRFDYRVMRVGRWAVAPLYLYVALQVAWDRVAATGGGEAQVVFALALVLKLYFLGSVVLWSRRRTLQSYFDYAAL